MICNCDGWRQEGADGPWCGDCGHHTSDHNGTGPEICEPGSED